MLNMSQNLAKHTKELEFFDPLVQELAEEATLDYLEMLLAIENKVEVKDLPQESELRMLSGCRDALFIVEIAGGNRLTLKYIENLVPKSVRERIMQNVHLTHSLDGMMVLNAKKRLSRT